MDALCVILCIGSGLLLHCLAVFIHLAVISRQVFCSIRVVVFAGTLGPDSGFRCRVDGGSRGPLDVDTGGEFVVVVIFVILIIVLVVIIAILNR